MPKETAESGPMIESVGLSKFYGDFAAARDVTFSMPRGQVCAPTSVQRMSGLGG